MVTLSGQNEGSFIFGHEQENEERKGSVAKAGVTCLLRVEPGTRTSFFRAKSLDIRLNPCNPPRTNNSISRLVGNLFDPDTSWLDVVRPCASLDSGRAGTPDGCVPSPSCLRASPFQLVFVFGLVFLLPRKIGSTQPIPNHAPHQSRHREAGTFGVEASSGQLDRTPSLAQTNWHQ